MASMKKIRIWSFGAVILFACQFLPTTIRAQDSQTASFNAFWTKFKAAVAKNDTEADDAWIELGIHN